MRAVKSMTSWMTIAAVGLYTSVLLCQTKYLLLSILLCRNSVIGRNNIVLSSTQLLALSRWVFIHITSKLHVSTGMRSTTALFKRDICSFVRVIFVYWTAVFFVLCSLLDFRISEFLLMVFYSFCNSLMGPLVDRNT